MWARFFEDESGATAIEYGLIAALIAVALISSMKNISEGLNAIFNKVSTELTLE